MLRWTDALQSIRVLLHSRKRIVDWPNRKRAMTPTVTTALRKLPGYPYPVWEILSSGMGLLQDPAVPMPLGLARERAYLSTIFPNLRPGLIPLVGTYNFAGVTRKF